MKRVWVVVVVVLLSACRGGAATVGPDDLNSVAEQTSLSAREFEATSTTSDRTVTVTGLVEDDFRYRAKVIEDRIPFYEEVVVDDGRYLRLLDLNRFAGIQPTDPGLAALLQGAWVVDPSGAPAEFIAPTADQPAQPSVLGPQAVLNRVRFLDRLPQLLTRGEKPVEHNPDAANYIPQFDKFPRHPQDGIRFDALPKPFDPGLSAISLEALEPFFQYVSVWVKGERVSRTERLFELPDPDEPRYRDMYEQIRRGIAAGPAVALLQQEAPRIEGLRITETYLFRAPPDTTRVEVPEGATTVNLVQLLTALQVATTGGLAPQLPALPVLPELPPAETGE